MSFLQQTITPKQHLAISVLTVYAYVLTICSATSCGLYKEDGENIMTQRVNVLLLSILSLRED